MGSLCRADYSQVVKTCSKQEEGRELNRSFHAVCDTKEKGCAFRGRCSPLVADLN